MHDYADRHSLRPDFAAKAHKRSMLVPTTFLFGPNQSRQDFRQRHTFPNWSESTTAALHMYDR